ncbi:DUF300-domain-containing protein [Neoconidiobolus thromboides FSU 785]|nr:DUF300-domain-containing protein [Neoconidiobolus thromboides FSU 785]
MIIKWEQDKEEWGEGGSGAELGETIINICLVFSILASLVSIIAMISHLKNYTKPHLQRYIIRIKWMVPVYAMSSWISLVSLNAAFYVDAIRDIYEAFVIYCFFNLMVNYMGGERALLRKLYGRAPIKHLWPAYYFSKEMEVGDPYSFLSLKRGILQYVYIKPMIAIITMVLKYTNNYDENDLSIYSGYFYITFVYNISVCISLYCLVFLFQTIKNDIKEYNPLAKFLCVKAIVFFSFWQGLVISALVSTGLVHLGNGLTEEHTAVALQDALICIELLFGAIAHWYAFTYKDYMPKNGILVRLKIFYAIRDAIGIKDIILDSVETYSGTKFNYRAFEPAEGAPITESGLNNRLKAGLRYSSNGQHKYWIKGAQGKLSHSTISSNDNRNENDLLSSITFDFVMEDEVAEELYKNSRVFSYGDYNIPTIESFIKFNYSNNNVNKNKNNVNNNIHHNKNYSTPTPNLSQTEINKNNLKSNSSDAILESINHTGEPSNSNSNTTNNSTPNLNSTPILRSDSLSSSPWGSNLVGTSKEDWKNELKRLVNREVNDYSTFNEPVLDPWR